MKLTRHNLINILIVVVAVLGLGGFLALALPGENKSNDALDAIDAATTTTTRSVTTTTRPTTTTASTLSLAPSTTRPAPTATTVRTATTSKPSSPGTTRKPSPTTTAACGTAGGGSGAKTESSDNQATFTQGGDGSFSSSPSADPGNNGSDGFSYRIATARGASNTVKFIVVLTNNTGRTITFPDGLKVVVTLNPQIIGSPFTITPANVNDIRSCETITLTQERAIPTGSYSVSATSDVNYG
ncbi:MAG TPA: hypothetical protein VMZ22_05130 [Acidimicrobiales bacterium]|nr:hypothetical protein [Acidimicrobiales bacterium]